MNTLTSTSLSLSLSSIDMLKYNGYRTKFSENLIRFKRSYDFVGPFILFFLFAIMSLPLFDYSYWLGSCIFILLIVGIYLHSQFFSKKATIDIDEKKKIVELKNRFGHQSISFNQVKAVYLKSEYKGTFTSADKSTNEEYDITLGVSLKKGKSINLFLYKSDYQEPGSEIIEVHNYLKSLFAS